MRQYQWCDALENVLQKKLTRRETEVLVLLIHGVPSKEAAWGLGIRPKTMERHIGNIMLKLEAHCRYDVIIAGVKMGLHRELRWLPGTSTACRTQAQPMRVA